MLDRAEDGFDKGRGVSARFLGQSLVTLEGSAHDSRRARIAPAFTGEAVGPYADRMVELAERAAGTWDEGTEFDAQSEMGRLNVAVAVFAFFGLEPDSDRGRELTGALHAASAAVAKPLARRRFATARARLDRLIAGLVREARTGKDERKSVLTALARAGKESLPDQAIRDELVTMYSGHNSVGLGLSWTLYLLATNPDAGERLRAELDELEGSPGHEDLGHLGYARACVAEALRMLPPIWILVRRATRDHELDGRRIPEGAMVLTSQYLLQQDARYWSDPETYRPERWLEPDAERPRFAYFPFGGGSRDCVGEPFARMEMILTLATVMRGRCIGLVPGAEVHPRARVKLAARDGVPLRVEPLAG